MLRKRENERAGSPVFFLHFALGIYTGDEGFVCYGEIMGLMQGMNAAREFEQMFSQECFSLSFVENIVLTLVQKKLAKDYYKVHGIRCKRMERYLIFEESARKMFRGILIAKMTLL